jgi:hypothetical protein
MNFSPIHKLKNKVKEGNMSLAAKLHVTTVNFAIVPLRKMAPHLYTIPSPHICRQENSRDEEIKCSL